MTVVVNGEVIGLSREDSARRREEIRALTSEVVRLHREVLERLGRS